MRLFIILSSAFLLLTNIGCKSSVSLAEPPLTFQEEIQVIRDQKGEYTLHFAKAAEYTVYVGSSSENIDWNTPIAKSRSKVLSFDDISFDDKRRYFFGVIKKKGDSMIVSERRISLDKTPNFRDLGGIPTKDGRKVKWGTFFRSGHLNDLTRSDQQYVQNLGIRSIYDFRAESETEEKPDKYSKDGSITYFNHPIIFDHEDTTRLKERFLNGEMSLEESSNLLVQGNQLFGGDLAYRFKPLVEEIKTGKNLPIVYHCTGGKDRTGFSTLLLLSILGVEEGVIMNEYLMSNYYRYEQNQKSLRKAYLGSLIKRKLNPELLKPLIIVKEDYLQAALNVIKKQYGNMDAFLEKEYGITESIRLELQQKYTY
ncbi:MAG: tyrosine-protein phosphatase [Bacteroidetes bacterium]|nr:tyrosine-protein phosphatase [Bacteroidota bacterium]